MKKRDLLTLIDLADLMNEESVSVVDREKEVLSHKEEIIHYLDIIKEENPDGFWYYGVNYERATLYFLNMVTKYFHDKPIYPIKKGYKLQNDYCKTYRFASNCTEEKLNEAIEVYFHKESLIYQDTKEGILYAIENHIPTSYLRNNIRDALISLCNNGFITCIEQKKLRERRIAYFLG